MLDPKWARKFAWRLPLFYVLLVIPWPGVREGYGVAFRAVGNQVFGSFGSQGIVKFRPLVPKKPKRDTEVYLRNRRQKTFWLMNYSSRYSGYLPTAAVIALILATPTPWSRRWRALLLGLFLVNGFVAIRVAISLVSEFRLADLFVYGPFWDRAIDVMYDAVAVSTVTSIVIPAMIWVLVTFRRDDLLLATTIGDAGRGGCLEAD